MKRIILVFFIFAFLLFLNSEVWACTCIRVPPEESFERSTAVFAGRVVEKEFSKSIPELILRGYSSADPVKVTFEVSEIWRGPDYKTIVLTTAVSEASCGYSFREGEEYLVYAYGKENRLETGLCSGTKLLSEAQADILAFGEGKVPKNPGSNVPLFSNLFMIIPIVVALIAILGIVKIMQRKKMK